MELGCVYEMVAQIQAVSGILNMGNRTRRAYWANTFGYQSASRLRGDQFRSLAPAFSHSRGSILRKFGRFSGARERLRRALPVANEASPYSLSKYAVALAATRTTGAIDTALRMMFEVALPLAVSRGESLGYVKRDAASLALAVGDYGRATTLLAEAAICKLVEERQWWWR